MSHRATLCLGEREENECKGYQGINILNDGAISLERIDFAPIRYPQT